MTYDLTKADAIYHEMVEQNPHFDHDLILYWRDNMPKEFARTMHERKHGLHIFDEDLYNEATALFVNKDETHGPHWNIDTIKSKSGIDFDSKEYTCYDYAYVVNMLFSDYGNIFTEPGYYLRMAKNYLQDEDYYGNPSERAYCNAIKRINYFKH